MEPTRVLAQAAGAWLQYEFACGKANLFSERYMSVPIAEALGSVYKSNIHSEFLHPVLAPLKSGRGRRPEVDFAVVETFPKIRAVVESKWVSRNGLNAEDVLWDLLRLDTIASAEGADAYFLLGGRRKYIQTFFDSPGFLGKPTALGRYRRLLKTSRLRRWAALRIDNPAADRLPMLKKLFSTYQDVSFPSRLTMSRPAIYPEQCPNFQYQVWVWQILALTGTPRFKPSNHSLYRTEGPEE